MLQSTLCLSTIFIVGLLKFFIIMIIICIVILNCSFWIWYHLLIFLLICLWFFVERLSFYQLLFSNFFDSFVLGSSSWILWAKNLWAIFIIYKLQHFFHILSIWKCQFRVWISWAKLLILLNKVYTACVHLTLTTPIFSKF